MKKSSTAAQAAPKSLFDRCRRGWNWHFVFDETSLEDGTRAVVVRMIPLFKTVYGLDMIISPYPGGRREDTVVEAIHEAFRDLSVDAAEDGVPIRDISDCNFEKLAIAAPVDSGIVQRFVAALSRIRRVFVEFKASEKEVCRG